MVLLEGMFYLQHDGWFILTRDIVISTNTILASGREALFCS